MNQLIQEILEDTNDSDNPYFVALKEHTFDRSDFIETQVQFYYAVTFFSRPMAVVATKLPDIRLRREVLRNVWEEHGEGVGGQEHGVTFLELLHRLDDLSEQDVLIRKLWPEVRMFNTTLIGACVHDEYLIGAGVLGMIEQMFAKISTLIGHAIVEQGWISEDQLIHYTLHAELDVRHADDFFNVLRPVWERGGEDRYYIEQGLRLGAHCFDQLYRGLYAARARRWTRKHLINNMRT